MAEFSDDGFMLDEWGHEIGYCNACGEEAQVGFECCDDGEIVPPAAPGGES
jgi:hypothetical protein